MSNEMVSLSSEQQQITRQVKMIQRKRENKEFDQFVEYSQDNRTAITTYSTLEYGYVGRISSLQWYSNNYLVLNKFLSLTKIKMLGENCFYQIT